MAWFCKKSLRCCLGFHWWITLHSFVNYGCTTAHRICGRKGCGVDAVHYFNSQGKRC